MKRVLLIALGLVVLAVVPRQTSRSGLTVASKKFTESVILGEIAAQKLRAAGVAASHLSELGGTRMVFDALARGDVDVYPEYTGTLVQEIFAQHAGVTDADLDRLLAAEGLAISRSLGFSNGYALAVTPETAAQYKLEKISDLAAHPELRLGFGNEFLDRGDGWKNLRQAYGLTHQRVEGMDHDLAYRRLEAGTIDVMDVYTTDAQLAELDLVLLDDDRRYFGSYEAVLLYRQELASSHPQVVRLLHELEGQIATAEMIQLNASVAARNKSEAEAAADYLNEVFGLSLVIDEPTIASQIWQRTLEHCDLVRHSLIPAIFVAIPLGIAAANYPRAGQIILGIVGIVQTIPALALLVLLIPVVAAWKPASVGAGLATAVAALFLYSLLPIVRNTASGLISIAPEHRESARALGLSPSFRLWHIELPLASPAILAGIKTAAVLNVGFATLGALVGARGYGQPILTGIRLNDTGLIMQGAVPAACLAVLLQIGFELAERWFLPGGLRPLRTENQHVQDNG